MWLHPRSAAAASRALLPALPAVQRPAVLGAAAVASGQACALSRGHRRGIMGPAGPTQALVDAAGYPADSMSRNLLLRCMDEAVLRGIDVTSVYTPWLPVDVMQTLIINVHDGMGCSWFMSIVVACLGIRVVTLPVSIAAIRGAREKALIQPEFQKLTEQQRQLSMEGNQQKAQEVAKKLQAFTQKHGKLFMLKGSWNLICFQMPLYITAFAAMRGFANYPDVFRGFAMEAPLWLDSLALSDPYCLMPLFTASLMLTNTELHGSIDTEVSQASPLAEVGGQPATMQKYQKWVMRGAAVMFIPMTWNFPAGVFVFMSTNMLCSSFQNRILRLPALERLLEIPALAKDQEAANIAASKGPPALLPLAGTVPQLARGSSFGMAVANSAGARQARPVVLAPARPTTLRDALIAARAAAHAAAPEKVSLDALEVKRKFAVRKVRPAQAV